jgi:pilus assembly protein CpaC
MRARTAASIAGIIFLMGAAAQAAEKPKPLIQIGVEVVEVDEQRAMNLGIQWFNTLHIQEASVPSLFEVGTLTRGAIFADLQFLEQNGAADLLANPKLVARDGTSATFHAGGEIPYATAASLGTVTVEFKAYGVDLKVSPHLNEQDQIELSVDAEVSGPDSQNGVTLSGNVVPGIRSRKASSELTLAPGATLTMAGLLQNDKEWTREGVPVLMHIPFLKYLFSHKVKSTRKTSIVIFVTPTILEAPKAPVASNRMGSEDDLLKIEDQKDMGAYHG